VLYIQKEKLDLWTIIPQQYTVTVLIEDSQYCDTHHGFGQDPYRTHRQLRPQQRKYHILPHHHRTCGSIWYPCSQILRAQPKCHQEWTV
jgi:hypothetical protein